MKHEYFPQGICPMKLDFELDGDVVKNIEFTGGCNGNLKAISTLVDGWTVDEICADQLCQALRKAKAGEI